MSSDPLKQVGIPKDEVKRLTKEFKVAAPKKTARVSEGDKPPYNPYEDGEVACVWELIRRNETFLEFEEAVKKLPPTVWCQSFQDLELGVRDVLWSLGAYIEKKPRRLSGKTWRKLSPDLRDELQKIWGGCYWQKGTKAEPPDRPQDTFPRDDGEEDLKAKQKAGRAGASHFESVAVVEGLYDMEPERQRKFLGKMQFAGFVPCFLLKGPLTEGEFKIEMNKLWDQLPERMKVDGRRRSNRFGTREQWEKFLTFERIKAENNFGRGRSLKETIKEFKGGADDDTMRAYERDFTDAIEFIEAWIKIILSTERPPDPPEKNKRSRAKKS